MDTTAEKLKDQLKGPQPSTPVDFFWNFDHKKENGKFYVEGWASTDDIDLESERIHPEAWEVCKSELLGLTMLYNHDTDHAIGKVEDVIIDKTKGLFIRGLISETEKTLQTKIDEEILKYMSVRYQASDDDQEIKEEITKSGKTIFVNNIYRVLPMEISITSTPCNRRAALTGTIGGKTVADLMEAVKSTVKEVMESITKAETPVEEEKEEKKEEEIKEEVKSETFDRDAFKTDIMSSVESKLEKGLTAFGNAFAIKMTEAFGKVVEAQKSEMDEKMEKVSKDAEETVKSMTSKVDEVNKSVADKIKAVENITSEPQGETQVRTKPESQREPTVGEIFFGDVIKAELGEPIPLVGRRFTYK